MSQPQPPAGDAPAYQHTPSGPPRLILLPAELRRMVYKFHLDDMIATLPETSLHIVYHFCDRRYEVTSDINRFRAQNPQNHWHKWRLLNLACAARLLRQEVEPELYDYFKFYVALRQHWNPLDLSKGDRYMLSHASELRIHLSIDHYCGFMPEHHQRDNRSLYRGVRRGSWDAASSLTFNYFADSHRLQIARPRNGSWSVPAQRTPYIHRLDALFDAVGHGINSNLKSLHIFISDIGRQHWHHDRAIARQLGRPTFETMLSHIETRVRVHPKCKAVLHLDQGIGDLLTRGSISQFLNSIQQCPPGITHLLHSTAPRRAVPRQIKAFLVQSTLIYLPRAGENFHPHLSGIFGPHPYGLTGQFRHWEPFIPPDEWWCFRLQP